MRSRQLDMVMVHAEPPRVMEFIRAGDHMGLAKYLAGFILRMKDTGAEFAVVPAVTPLRGLYKQELGFVPRAHAHD